MRRSFLGGISVPLMCGFLLLGLVAPRTCSASEGREVAELLASSDPIQWLEAVMQLATAGDMAALVRLLREDPRKEVRTGAGLALAGFQEAQVIEALSQALADPEPWVRLVAVEALGFLGAGEVKAPLQRALRDHDPLVRKLAEDALERMKKEREVPFSTLRQGSSSAIKNPGLFVLSTDQEWRDLWAKHASSEPPRIDFSREMALAVFMGEQQTAGFHVEIQKVEDKGRMLKVVVQYVSPTPGNPRPRVLTQPYHIVQLEKQRIPVRFVRTSLIR